MSGRPPGIFQSTEVADARWQQTLWPDPAFVVAAVGIIDGMDVIDLCCDDGWLTLAIAKIAQHVTAVSNDAGMLGLTCIRMNENRIFNCAYQLADARELADFAAKPVDFIFMANSFHRVGDRISLSRAVGETLRPGGHFANKPPCAGNLAARGLSYGFRRKRPSRSWKRADSRARQSSSFRPTTTGRFSKNLSA
jgi:SAM-dependent methyltransferase